MDIELQARKNPEEKITVLYNHWITVLEPQGQWEPVQQTSIKAEVPDEKVAPKKRGRPKKEES
jgi:hypothetical protein